MGIQINGATDSITAIDGTIDVVSAIGNAGVVTATAFVGNITGNVTGNINHTSALELQVGGVTRGKFDSSGRLGIGTDNPTEDLHITGDTPVIRLEDSDTSRQSQIVGIDGNLRFDADNGNAQADTNISFRTDGSEVLHIASDGKVKIGSGSPSTALLHIAPATYSLNLQNNSNNKSMILFTRNSNAGDARSWIEGNGESNGYVLFGTGNNERLRIDSSGRVGVNTSVPENSDTMQIFATTTPLLTIKAGASGSDSNRRASLRFWTNGNKIYKFEADASDGGLKIYDSSTERLRITSAGVLQMASGGNLEMSSNGRIFVGNGGNETNPMFANVSDTNTGIAFPAADTMMFTTGGTERLRITSAGKIGINQSGPFADVDITSSVEDTDNSSLAQHGIRLAHIGAANEEVIPITAGFVAQQNRARAGIGFISKTISGADGMGGAIGFYTRNTADGHALYRNDERVRITESGQFLVGATSSTGARAIIQQNSSDTNPLDQQTCADSSGLRLHNYSFSTGRYTALSMECCNTSSVQSASIVAQSTSSGTSPNIIFTQRNSNTTNAERLRIDSSGYLVKGSGLTCAFNVKGSNMARTNSDAYVCQFNNESSSGCFDSGNNFNTSTYKFVAPVSGYYYFFTNIRLDAYGVGYIRTAILSTSYHAGTTYYAIPATGHVITYPTNGSGIMTVQTSTVMYLPATHEAWVYQNPQNDTSYTVYLNESSFGGYFIG